jgi:hypothetical protein
VEREGGRKRKFARNHHYHQDGAGEATTRELGVETGE